MCIRDRIDVEKRIAAGEQLTGPPAPRNDPSQQQGREMPVSMGHEGQGLSQQSGRIRPQQGTAKEPVGLQRGQERLPGRQGGFCQDKDAVLRAVCQHTAPGSKGPVRGQLPDRCAAKRVRLRLQIDAPLPDAAQLRPPGSVFFHDMFQFHDLTFSVASGGSAPVLPPAGNVAVCLMPPAPQPKRPVRGRTGRFITKGEKGSQRRQAALKSAVSRASVASSSRTCLLYTS